MARGWVVGWMGPCGCQGQDEVFIPVFFATSDLYFDLAALFANSSTTLRVPKTPYVYRAWPLDASLRVYRGAETAISVL